MNANSHTFSKLLYFSTEINEQFLLNPFSILTEINYAQVSYFFLHYGRKTHAICTFPEISF